jgi:hypothetical protein
MKIIEKLTVSVLCLLISQSSFCQEKYIPGCIITKNGDTIQGYLDYKIKDLNPDKIFFKKELTDEKLLCTPHNIQEFHVLDENYVSAIVETEVSSNETNELNYFSNLELQTDTTFLQSMIQGTKSLYFYKNHVGKDQFYIGQNSSFVLLVYKRYLINPEEYGKILIKENKRYYNQLNVYLDDCPKIQAKLNTVSYNKRSMERLFLSYYNCTNSEITFQKKTERTPVEFGILAGLTLTSLKFRSTPPGYLSNLDLNQPLNIAAGLFAEVSLNRRKGKWSLYNELVFTSYKINGYYNDYKNKNDYTIYNIAFGYSYLKINNMLRFKYPVGNSFLYLNAGISNGYAIQELNEKKVYTKFYSSESTETGKAIIFSRRYEQGYILGLGANYKRISFEVRQEKSNGMSAITQINSNVNKYYLLLGYRF